MKTSLMSRQPPRCFFSMVTLEAHSGTSSSNWNVDRDTSAVIQASVFLRSVHWYLAKHTNQLAFIGISWTDYLCIKTCKFVMLESHLYLYEVVPLLCDCADDLKWRNQRFIFLFSKWSIFRTFLVSNIFHLQYMYIFTFPLYVILISWLNSRVVAFLFTC